MHLRSVHRRCLKPHPGQFRHGKTPYEHVSRYGKIYGSSPGQNLSALKAAMDGFGIDLVGSWLLLIANQLQCCEMLALVALKCSSIIAAVGSWFLQVACQLHVLQLPALMAGMGS